MRDNEIVIVPPKDSQGVPHPVIEVTREQIEDLKRGWMLNALAKAAGYADSEDLEEQRRVKCRHFRQNRTGKRRAVKVTARKQTDDYA